MLDTTSIDVAIVVNRDELSTVQFARTTMHCEVVLKSFRET